MHRVAAVVKQNKRKRTNQKLSQVVLKGELPVDALEEVYAVRGGRETYS